MKWYAIMVIGALVAMMIPAAIGAYSRGDCVKSYAASNRPVDEIKELCR